MPATQSLRLEQELIERFLAAFSQNAVNLTRNKPVEPETFISACQFIRGYIEEGYYQNETLLLSALEECGLSTESGPLAHMLSEITQTSAISAEIQEAARQWQAGDENGRNSIAWAASGYISLLRQHLERSRAIIFPLANQLLDPGQLEKIEEAFTRAAQDFESLVAALESEASAGK